MGVAVPVRRHRGETLLVCGSLPDEELARITLADERPAPAPGRPVIHFSPENGWLNDPNGLVRLSDGEARMYYQYHPFGVEWGPMHWGSASSRDLLHWEAGDIALFPDRDGTIFSGSGWRDDENAAGFLRGRHAGSLVARRRIHPAPRRQRGRRPHAREAARPSPAESRAR